MQRGRQGWIELRRLLWRLWRLGGFSRKAVGALPPYFQVAEETKRTRQLGLAIERAHRGELDDEEG